MLFRPAIIQLVILGLFSISVFSDPYVYKLEAEHESRAGHISHDAEKGSRVAAEIDEPPGHHSGDEEPEPEIYLKVHITTNIKPLLPQKHTTRGNFDMSMVPNRQTQNQRNRDNTNTASTTFNHVPTHTARMTGNHVTSNHNTGSQIPSRTQKFTTKTKIVTSSEQPAESVTLVTNQHTGSVEPDTGNHNIHITNNFPKQTTTLQKVPVNFRNIPRAHNHNIHITHLQHDPVHPIVNKRSVDDLLNEENNEHRMDNLNRNRGISHRKKRHFAVPPADFQPEHLRPTSKKRPRMIIKDTNAFLVDPIDKFIRVNDTSHIGDHTFISFYVVLEDEDGVAVSNPLPFLVHIDQPEPSNSYPAVSAVFAGVLVLIVIFLAVMIPLVTRAKRRYKQRKPMFKLGSNPSRDDLDKAGMETKTNMPRNMSSEPNWYGNKIFYDYEDELAHGRSDFTAGLRQYSTKSEPPILQLHKKQRDALSENSSTSGIETSSQGATGSSSDSYSQRM